MKRLLLLTVLCALIAPLGAQTVATTDAARPPMAAQKPKDVTVHGDKRIDEFFWLRERNNPEVIEHLKAENAWADRYFAPYAAFEESLYKEILGRVQQRDQAVPRLERGYWYVTRTEEGKQYPILTRRKGSVDAPEEVLLDLNKLAEGKKFLALGAFDVSDNNRLLAYTTDETGGRDYTLHIKDLQTGKYLDKSIKDISEIAWAADSRTLFYTTVDAAKRTYRLWKHVLGSKGKDQLLAEEKDEMFDLDLGRTRSGDWIVLTSRSKDTSDIRVIDARKPASSLRRIVARKTGREVYLSHHAGAKGGDFYLLVNDTGPNNRLVRVAAASKNTETGAWKELIAHRKDVMLESADLFRGFMVLRERDKGAQKLRVFDLAKGFDAARSHYIAMDAAVYSARGMDNSEYDTSTYRFAYTSLATPNSVFDYDMASKKRELRKVQPVLGGYDPKRYTERQVMARAKDGTEVPISLIWRTDLRKTGPQPLLLYGYGSYGFPSDPGFSLSRVSLLDRGVIFAIAHIRGGGDLGRQWYLDGKLGKKMNTFTDFIASAETLIAQGYTEPSQLIIQGGSAGGLLMGAVTNLRPDLFKAVVSEVPFVDVINTMLDETLPLTTGEFIEWGNPKNLEDYKVIRAYSPYDNLKRGAYPAIYLRTGFNDSQVPYWEPAKYAARLRTLKTDNTPLLFNINMGVGHGGASGRFDALRERARVFTFMLSQWGLAQPQAAASAAAPTAKQ
jgi:oligopeptidase B